jgi:very-short-patch-repair endonuclease
MNKLRQKDLPLFLRRFVRKATREPQPHNRKDGVVCPCCHTLVFKVVQWSPNKFLCIICLDGLRAGGWKPKEGWTPEKRREAKQEYFTMLRKFGGLGREAKRGIYHSPFKKLIKDEKLFIYRKAQQLRKHPTQAEVVFGGKLKDLHIPFVPQAVFYYCGFYGIYDFFLFKHNTIIEVDGGYHTNYARAKADNLRDDICENYMGKRVIRLTNQQAIEITLDNLSALIEQQKRDGIHPAINCATGVSVGQNSEVLTKLTNTADYVQTDSDGQSGCDIASNRVLSAK